MHALTYRLVSLVAMGCSLPRPPASCHWDTRGGHCEKCRGKHYLNGDVCVEQCPSNLAHVATPDGRVCMSPFVCTEGSHWIAGTRELCQLGCQGPRCITLLRC